MRLIAPPRLAQGIRDASVAQQDEPALGERRPCEVAEQGLQPDAIPGRYRRAGVQAPAERVGDERSATQALEALLVGVCLRGSRALRNLACVGTAELADAERAREAGIEARALLGEIRPLSDLGIGEQTAATEPSTLDRVANGRPPVAIASPRHFATWSALGALSPRACRDA